MPDWISNVGRELVKRTALLSAIAWVSLCLITVGMSPPLRDQLSGLWLISGLVGLLSSVGLTQVVQRERRRGDMAHMVVSRRDTLTGLANRREFDRLINIMIADAHSHDLALSLVLIDVDSMQRVNQQEGYSSGDEVLDRVAKLVLETIRGADLVSRYGDDEFAVVLADVDRPTCKRVIERVRTQVQAKVLIGGKPVTVSVGAACIEPSDDAASLLHRAELALFRSKSEGRDRSCYHDGQQLHVLTEPVACHA